MTGQEFKSLIKNNGLNVKEVAGKLGISRQSMYAWFKKDKLPKHKAQSAKWAVDELTKWH